MKPEKRFCCRRVAAMLMLLLALVAFGAQGARAEGNYTNRLKGYVIPIALSQEEYQALEDLLSQPSPEDAGEERNRSIYRLLLRDYYRLIDYTAWSQAMSSSEQEYSEQILPGISGITPDDPPIYLLYKKGFWELGYSKENMNELFIYCGYTLEQCREINMRYAFGLPAKVVAAAPQPTATAKKAPFLNFSEMGMLEYAAIGMVVLIAAGIVLSLTRFSKQNTMKGREEE